jgi:putative phosphoesterase
MRVALIGDVHGNLPALQAVLEHARQHRTYEVWGAGDWVGSGDFPEEVVQLLQQRKVKAVIGNYDLSVLEVATKRAKWGPEGPPTNWQPAAWTYDQLSAENREYLRSLPAALRLETAGRRVLLTHINPASSDEPIGPDTSIERLRQWAQAVAADVVVVGHTHVPLARKVDGIWFINTGSVGRPKDGPPSASYAILTLGQKRVQVRHYHVDYRVSKAEAVAEPVQAVEAKPAALEATGRSSSSAPAVPQAAADERLKAVMQLAQSCEYEEGHTQQVTRLALRLFDELKLVHGLGPRERYWLQCGALLHDIGLIEGVQGHHKASLRIILDSPILTFDKRERLIIGSIARYHRAALPQERHRHFAALKPGLRRIVRILAAILRVADGLDYTHQSLVNEVYCELSAKQVIIRCAVKGPAEDERQRALQKGDLLAEVLERKLVVECQEP